MKLLVLEGLDGSGKSTQLGMIQEYFDQKGIKYKYLHFPRTDSALWGELISMFLRGEFGSIGEVNPYLVALIYACDRNEAKSMIGQWLDDGYVVILDRYVNSNIAYQCAKFDDAEKKSALRKWIKKLEFEYNGLHRPGISLFLDVPFEFTERKLQERTTDKNRDYLRGSDDIHEQNLEFQKKVWLEYLNLVGEDENFKLINCSDDRLAMLPVDIIFGRIKKELERSGIY